MQGKFIDRTGEVGISNEGLRMWIIAYRGAFNIDVEFENGYIIKNVVYQNFKNGNIKNPYHLSVYGVGYMGEGEYKARINGEKTIQYTTWFHIMQRCYDRKIHLKYPTYKNCEIYKPWHNFQNFGKWFDENYYQIDGENMHIDKDILVKENKIYSPECCIIVPQNINLLFIKNNAVRGELPIGVSWSENLGKFKATLSKNNKRIYLGYFNTSKEAFEKYKTEKEKYIKEVADLYKDKIPQRLYDSMYRYEVEITD